MSPMVHLTVKIRNDLNMPLGKIASQAAHAVGAFVLGCFCFDKKDWKTPAATSCFGNPNLAQMIPEAIKLEHTAEEALNGADVMIIDQGHTVFKGQPTKTVGLFIEHRTKMVMDFSENPYTPSETTVRMTAVVNKLLVRKDKNQAVFDIVSAYAQHIIATLNAYRDGKLTAEQEEDLLAWCSGSFAKITLVGNAETLQACAQLKTDTPVLQQSYGENVQVLGPAKKVNMDAYTASFKML